MSCPPLPLGHERDAGLPVDLVGLVAVAVAVCGLLVVECVWSTLGVGGDVVDDV